MLHKKLTQLGLSEKEIKVYLFLVGHGFCPVSSLAKRCSLNRVTVYSVLESLTRKNLVTHRKISGYKHFAALEPSHLLYFLNEKMTILKMRMRMAQECIDQIKSIQAS